MKQDSLKNFKRTDYCGTLTAEDTGRTVILNGWVAKRRNLGSLVFVDLRDRTGICQITLDTSSEKSNGQELEKAIKAVRGEYVIGVKGVVKHRQGDVNKDLKTGEIEVDASEITVFNTAETTPFYIRDDLQCDETLRLKYRYLDLRRPKMQKYLITRHKITMAARKFLGDKGFLELETPSLTKSTPEGARDYLVPSRVHKGEFFALPQSPQMFKQLFMVAGFDRYFQIVKCFRDEDLRADRQPEFTQIDMEMSFIDQEDIITLVEGLMSSIYKEALGLQLKTPFPRISYDQAMDRFGVDRPDMRFGMELTDLTDIFKGCGFSAFKTDENSAVKGILLKGCAGWSRKNLDKLSDFVKIYKAGGAAYACFLEDGSIKCPIMKFMENKEIEKALEKMDAQRGDLLIMVSDIKYIANAALGALRIHLAKQEGLIPTSEFNPEKPDLNNYAFTWVVDFPLFEYDEEEKRFVARHHPFTSPSIEDTHLLASSDNNDKLKIHARAYDLVLNGSEIGGGSIRIHRKELQEQMFKALGISDQEAREKFGFLLDAFEYGAPPHGGLALGLDRIIMTMLNTDSIRDMIPFPKTQQAQCLMTQAPSAVAPLQLDELGISIKKQPC
jgi:aspartyl-tRNA synthetase